MLISIKEARALYDGGAAVSAVAQALGMDTDAFLRLRKRDGWPLRPSPIVVKTTAGEPKAPKRKSKPATRKPAARKPAARKAAARNTAAKPRDAAPVETPETPCADVQAPAAEVESAFDQPVNIRSVCRKLQAGVQGGLVTVEKSLLSGDPAEIERNARLLASLVKSLAELRRLEALEARSDDGAGAADASEDERPPRDLETLRDELARALERMSADAAGQGAGG